MLGGAIAGLGARPNPFATAATTTNTKSYQARFYSDRSSSCCELVFIMHASCGRLANGPFWHLAKRKSVVKYVLVRKYVSKLMEMHRCTLSYNSLYVLYAYEIALCLTEVSILPGGGWLRIQKSHLSLISRETGIDKVPIILVKLKVTDFTSNAFIMSHG